MVPDTDLGMKSASPMEVLAGKDNGSSLGKMEDKLMVCASNRQEDVPFDDQPMIADERQDAEINIAEFTYDGVQPIEAAEQDSTESSSSFGDTKSGVENGSILSDDEVDSHFLGGNPSSWMYGEYGGAFQVRKKRLTEHWRRFIQPLMWRCKWIEVQIKKLQSQASKYVKELAIYDQRRQFQLDNFAVQDSGAKSLPFPSQIGGNKFLRRKKRKRVEETTDIASYMSNHSLFSYYENKRSFADCASLGDVSSNPVIPVEKGINGNNEFGAANELLRSRYGDDSMERILWKIDKMQAQVCNLRTRADKVVIENPRKFSSINKLSVLVCCDAKTSSGQDLVTHSSDGDRMSARSLSTASHPILGYHVGDSIMPNNGTTSHGAMAPFSNLTENIDQSVGEDVLIKSGDGILVNNETVKADLLYSENVGILPTKKRRVLKEVQEDTIPSDCYPAADTPIDALVVQTEKSKATVDSKINANKKNKRKRGRRKAGSGRWS